MVCKIIMVGKIKHFGLKAGKRFTNGDDRFFAGICLIPIGAFKRMRIVVFRNKPLVLRLYDAPHE
jgi:hypothetical protein